MITKIAFYISLHPGPCMATMHTHTCWRGTVPQRFMYPHPHSHPNPHPHPHSHTPTLTSKPTPTLAHTNTHIQTHTHTHTYAYFRILRFMLMRFLKYTLMRYASVMNPSEDICLGLYLRMHFQVTSLNDLISMTSFPTFHHAM